MSKSSMNKQELQPSIYFFHPKILGSLAMQHKVASNLESPASTLSTGKPTQSAPGPLQARSISAAVL